MSFFARLFRSRRNPSGTVTITFEGNLLSEQQLAVIVREVLHHQRRNGGDGDESTAGVPA